MRMLTVIPVLLSMLLVASSGYGDVVTDWNSAAVDAIRVGRTPPPSASRALAMLHVAIYDAVNGISRTHEAYHVVSVVPRSASEQAAAAAAAHIVLVALFPASTGGFDALYVIHLAAIRESPHKSAGVSWGERVGAEILLSRSTDNSGVAVDPPASDAPGSWQRTGPAFAPYLQPGWGFVVPFAMPDGSFFRPDGPPALASAEYAAAFAEVKAFGAMTGSSRTPEQSTIALFWADGAGTETPPGHWNSIARQVAQRDGNTLEQNARLFALLNIAMADAAISAWDAKYTFNNWRPVTAIRNGADDGNAATVADPSWNSFIVNPPFPDYVSGHSTFSAAAATVLAMFYGSDDVVFTASSDGLPGVVRAFSGFSAAAAEAATSRLYGGIHFRFAIEDGMAAGVAIGEWAFTHSLTVKGNRSRK